MSRRRTINLVLSIALAACLVGLSTMAAMAAPSAAQTSADRAAVKRAVERYEATRAESADIEARMAESSAKLDRAVAQEKRARSTFRSRMQVMYRSGDADLISALLGASTVQDFMTRWNFFARIARQDAENLRVLKAARADAEKSAENLLDLQAKEARALDALADEVARAKKDLATSQAALREYEAKTAASAKAAAVTAPKPAAKDPTQRLSGSGAWKTGVASHYGRDFTGRGASGEEIGPYSMIVAHKTLPFGTLIEFEYDGKRAVARVADRGPRSPDRDFDLGPGVVRVLDFSGVHEVRYRIISQ